MMMGDGAPPAAVIEVATGSPFGMQMVGGTMPFFDPYGWNPEIGIERALASLGWTAEKNSGGGFGAALDRLTSALGDGPVMVGPVEMGYLRYQPGKTGPIGADHYALVLGVDGERVLLHDPQGYPYAQLPVADFMEAWRGDGIDYGEPYTMRTNFIQVASVGVEDVIGASIPGAIDWLGADSGHPMPPGSLGNAAAAAALAALLESGRGEEWREHLVHFAVRVGARRVTDAATCLQRIGHAAAAAVMSRQARLIGSLQYSLVTGDFPAAAGSLRALAPTYGELRAELVRTEARRSTPGPLG
ncbi:hypothetical protein [Actinomadura sp. 21ATH]|uniref:hypothetical protein n=1 Tax=Actinomadura sp. 21ATH TaxID=1735444 RepID=UPI0035C05953